MGVGINFWKLPLSRVNTVLPAFSSSLSLQVSVQMSYQEPPLWLDIFHGLKRSVSVLCIDHNIQCMGIGCGEDGPDIYVQINLAQVVLVVWLLPWLEGLVQWRCWMTTPPIPTVAESRLWLPLAWLKAISPSSSISYQAWSTVTSMNPQVKNW